MRRNFIYTTVGIIILIIMITTITSCTKENNDLFRENASQQNNIKEVEEKLFTELPKYFKAKYELYTTGDDNNILGFYNENTNKVIDDINILKHINGEVFGEIDSGEYSFILKNINSLELEENVYVTNITSFEKEILFDDNLKEEFESSGYSEYLISFTFDENNNLKILNDLELNETSKRWSHPKSNELKNQNQIDNYIKTSKEIYKKSSINEDFNLLKNRPNYIEAVRYAIRNVYSPDSSVCDYSDGGGDCTNFVSNAMHKGGKIRQKSRKWFHKYSSCRNSRRIYSLSWTVANNFYLYMLSSSIMYPQSISLNSLKMGDVISFKKRGDNRAVHTAIVTKKRNSKVYITYRNGGGASPALNKRLSSVSLDILQIFRPRY